jgi:uncharacterized membrane protein
MKRSRVPGVLIVRTHRLMRGGAGETSGGKDDRMRSLGPIAALFPLIAACGGPDNSSAPIDAPAAEAPADAPGSPANEAQPGPAARWDLQSSGEGVALALLAEPDRTAIRLFCPAGEDRLLVNVPAFRPIGSEERLSFGSGGEVVALVADPRGDRRRGGVSGTGAVPDELDALVRGPLSASYGAQTSGPHPAPPPQLARAFVAACREGAAPARPPTTGPTASTGPCLMQDGARLDIAPLRALGTEPFWNARIEGRCVTYSHPEDQDGTRVWTRFTPRPGGGVWAGALGGRRFELRTRAEPGCSDGMSDNRYPIAVELLVGGEQRRGCAQPL